MSSFISVASTLITAFRTRFGTDEKGATAVEYGLLVALIAAVIVGVVASLGTEIQVGFQTVVDQLVGGGGGEEEE